MNNLKSTDSKTNQTYLGISLAITAVIIWSGNFVIARGVSHRIGPVSLAFYRWGLATVLLAPFAWKKMIADKKAILAKPNYLFWVSLTGIVLFNTLVYVAGHHTTAINLALIGTTSSPIFATILAIIFLKDRPGIFRITGMFVCITGIILLISRGSLQTLMAFHFSEGDLWVMGGAMAFAIYNVMVRKKPSNISTLAFLFVIFAAGTLMLLPPFILEYRTSPPVQWDWSLVVVIIYLGLGNSIISFLCWNLAIEKIGTGRTVLFGNLIPIFSVIEAVLFLGEKMTTLHIISGVVVIAGLVLANIKTKAISK